MLCLERKKKRVGALQDHRRKWRKERPLSAGKAMLSLVPDDDGKFDASRVPEDVGNFIVADGKSRKRISANRYEKPTSMACLFAKQS